MAMSAHRATNHLVLATTNRGKVEELRALLADMDVVVMSVDDVLKARAQVVEDGATFESNAIKKASAVASATRMLTLADDSGLEVLALDGAPGVHSARYAHERATDAENNAALLAAIEALGDPVKVGSPELTARFRCVLALIDPFFSDGAPIVVEGTCDGAITCTPRGAAGFGYDPLFVVKSEGKTLAELGDAKKNEVSHRARAVLALRPVLARVLAARARDVSRVESAMLE
jgi:XTP/dITP diphosphohydrolase